MGIDRNRCLERTTRGAVVADCKEDERMKYKTFIHVNGGFDIAEFKSYGAALSHVLKYNDGLIKEVYSIDEYGCEYLEWRNLQDVTELKDIQTPMNPADPQHYKTKSMECREVIKVMVEGLTPMEAVDMANIVKYLYRFKHKDGMKDLKKVAEYAKFLIEDTDVDKGE